MQTFLLNLHDGFHALDLIKCASFYASKEFYWIVRKYVFEILHHHLSRIWCRLGMEWMFILEFLCHGKLKKSHFTYFIISSFLFSLHFLIISPSYFLLFAYFPKSLIYLKISFTVSSKNSQSQLYSAWFVLSFQQLPTDILKQN